MSANANDIEEANNDSEMSQTKEIISNFEKQTQEMIQKKFQGDQMDTSDDLNSSDETEKLDKMINSDPRQLILENGHSDKSEPEQIKTENEKDQNSSWEKSSDSSSSSDDKNEEIVEKSSLNDQTEDKLESSAPSETPSDKAKSEANKKIASQGNKTTK